MYTAKLTDLTTYNQSFLTYISFSTNNQANNLTSVENWLVPSAYQHKIHINTLQLRGMNFEIIRSISMRNKFKIL
jgi:hypothetical protein